jgi:hypothetical protein
MDHLCMARLMQFVAYVFLVRWDFLVAYGVEFRATNQQQQISFVTKSMYRFKASHARLSEKRFIDAALSKDDSDREILQGDPISVDGNRHCRLLPMMLRDSFSATAMLTARW